MKRSMEANVQRLTITFGVEKQEQQTMANRAREATRKDITQHTCWISREIISSVFTTSRGG